MVNTVMERFGRIDILVNNAGVIIMPLPVLQNAGRRLAQDTRHQRDRHVSVLSGSVAGDDRARFRPNCQHGFHRRRAPTHLHVGLRSQQSSRHCVNAVTGKKSASLALQSTRFCRATLTRA